MIDKRARLDEIRALTHCVVPKDYSWLITELEAAWAEVEQADNVLACQRDIAIQHSYRAEAAEKLVKLLEEALGEMLGISHRIEGCSDPRCMVCKENDAILARARAALAESAKQMEEAEK